MSPPYSRSLRIGTLNPSPCVAGTRGPLNMIRHGNFRKGTKAMIRHLFAGTITAAITATTLLYGAACAQDSLERPQWWPSEYGPEDQLGAANRLGPKKVLAA